MAFIRAILVALLLTTVTACASKDTKEEELPSAEEMYNQAYDLLQERRYEKAVVTFQDIERTYPYAKWAIKAQIMAAYAYYEDQQYGEAISVLDRFIKLHPAREEVSYAYYLKALSYYEQISDVNRDQGYSLKAHKALKEVIARFPESKYAKDAMLKIDLVLDHLAGKEVAVGRFYLKRGKTIAAINRFKNVLQDYETTAHVQEALHRLVEAYLSLGITVEAEKYAAVLGHNYPSSKWYRYSYRLLRGKNAPEHKEVKAEMVVKDDSSSSSSSLALPSDLQDDKEGGAPDI